MTPQKAEAEMTLINLEQTKRLEILRTRRRVSEGSGARFFGGAVWAQGHNKGGVVSRNLLE